MSQTSVYPRDVVKEEVKEALSVHAAAAILAHTTPRAPWCRGRADEFLTQTLKTALALVDVRVLDHLVVAGTDMCSFAERGLVQPLLGAPPRGVPSGSGQADPPDFELIRCASSGRTSTFR